MIFEPQPLELFAADKAPARLTRLREKLRYLAESGVDYVLCVRFDRRFAALTAQDFVSDLLVRVLACSSLPWAMISALALVARGFLVITEGWSGVRF
jgi:riboflavin kinase/FMN adenylyltransferase